MKSNAFRNVLSVSPVLHRSLVIKSVLTPVVAMLICVCAGTAQADPSITTYTDAEVSASTLNSNCDASRLFVNVLGQVADYNCTVFDGTALNIGNLNSYNTLTIQNGADLVSGVSAVGYGDRYSSKFSNYNSVVVTGAGSTWTAGSGSNSGISIGYSGNNNSLAISEGGTVNSGLLILGYFNSGSNNRLTVSGSGSTLNVVGTSNYDPDIIVGRMGTGNAVTVSGGAHVNSQRVKVGDYGSSSNITLTGSGTAWRAYCVATTTYSDVWVGSYASSNSLHILDGASFTGGSTMIGTHTGYGNNSIHVSGAGSLYHSIGTINLGASDSTGNTLLIGNGGLVVADGYFSSCLVVGSGTGNVVELAEGFLALKGDKSGDIATLLSAEQILVWDGSAYVTGGSLTVSYCDEAGEAATALGSYSTYYSDLLATLDGGYTIVTGGMAVPEPSTYALLGGLGALGFAMIRRRRAAKA